MSITFFRITDGFLKAFSESKSFSASEDGYKHGGLSSIEALLTINIIGNFRRYKFLSIAKVANEYRSSPDCAIRN
jgi:hypothetical protein